MFLINKNMHLGHLNDIILHCIARCADCVARRSMHYTRHSPALGGRQTRQILSHHIISYPIISDIMSCQAWDAAKLAPMARRAPRWRGGRHFHHERFTRLH